MPADANTTETPRDVLSAAVKAATTHEPPTAREVLQIMIRMECARAGLPRPDFDCFPPDAVHEQIFG